MPWEIEEEKEEGWNEGGEELSSVGDLQDKLDELEELLRVAKDSLNDASEHMQDATILVQQLEEGMKLVISTVEKQFS